MFVLKNYLFSGERIGEMYTRNQEQEEDDLLDSLTMIELLVSSTL
jgi:hypothetical protein